MNFRHSIVLAGPQRWRVHRTGPGRLRVCDAADPNACVLRLSGSLADLGLASILRLFNNARANCRLRVVKGDWTAELFLNEGQVVSAAFGLARGLGGAPSDPLRGIHALEAVVIFLADAAFLATGEPALPEPDPGLPLDSLENHLDDVQRRFVGNELTDASLLSVPVPCVVGESSSADDELTLTRRRLGLLLGINGHDTLIELFRGRDVIGTLEDLTWLQQHGLMAW
jgi:Domain of unknown function (DUF4388)